jgi:hypothetical protein
MMLTRILAGKGGLTAYVTRSDHICDMQIFQNPYLPHPHSEFDVPYMDLDLFDDNYEMVMSKLPFEGLD